MFDVFNRKTIVLGPRVGYTWTHLGCISILRLYDHVFLVVMENFDPIFGTVNRIESDCLFCELSEAFDERQHCGVDWMSCVLCFVAQFCANINMHKIWCLADSSRLQKIPCSFEEFFKYFLSHIYTINDFGRVPFKKGSLYLLKRTFNLKHS